MEGRRLFHTHFDPGDHTENSCSTTDNAFICNPVFTEQAGKSGPLMNTPTCDTCHIHNGRGAPLAMGETLNEQSSIVFKLYDSEELGSQLQLQEGTASVMMMENQTVMLGDGTPVELERPRYSVVPSDAAPPPGFSARVARRIVGMGLLEAIPENVILARSDKGDCDGNGISGRPQIVTDPADGSTRLGRVGWKAEKVSVAHQVADALDADLGVSSSLINNAGEVELGDEDFAKMVAYVRLLGLPGRRNVEDASVIRGEQLFSQIGCANCHVPTMATGGNHPDVEFRGQLIHPYTDLLLHHMGPDLADDSGTEFASEWRTPPLWGLGLIETVSGHGQLLHDGRAGSILEAILWHGGEAENVKQAVIGLGTADRDALLAFLQSL
jgi:CxxC motif-containing protein (DUF1111 family)